MTRPLRLISAIALVAVVCSASVVLGARAPLDDAADVDRPAQRLVAPTASGPTPEHRAARDMVTIVNLERARRGLSPYQWHDQVAAAAIAHSSEMAANRVMRHQGNNGSNAGARLLRAGFNSSAWGENIGAGFSEPQPLFTAWLASAPHRPQLTGVYRYIGVAVAVAADGTPYWTMVVAS
jgi:uncharacterized protein YkwD